MAADRSPTLRTSGIRTTRFRAAVTLTATVAVVLAGCSSTIGGSPQAATGSPPTTSSTSVDTSSDSSTSGRPTTGPDTSGSTDSTGTSSSAAASSPTGSTGPVPSPMILTGTRITRPQVPAGPAVRVAVSYPISDYGNNTLDTSAVGNTQLTTLVQPSAFFVDNLNRVAIDGDLMTSVAVTSKSPQTVVYQLNPKAVWSDGVPVSCKDFYLAWLAATSKAVAKNKSGTEMPAFDPAYTGGYDEVKSVTCSGGGRMITTAFSHPFADWQQLFDSMLPAHVIEKASGVADVTALKPTDTTGPVLAFAAAYLKQFAGIKPAVDLSAGPYLIESASSTKVVLSRNPKWWGNPAGPKSITLVAIEDEAARVDAVRLGEVQATVLTSQDPGLATAVTAMHDVEVHATAIPDVEHIDFNLARPVFAGAPGKALRQAVAQCIDRHRIVHMVAAPINPKATTMGSLVTMPWMPGYKDLYAAYRTANPAAAKRTMEAAGWKLGSDGIFARGATKASFTLGHTTRTSRLAISQLATADCAKAGIQIKDGQDAQFNTTALLSGDFDAALFAWSYTPFPSELSDLYTTKGDSNLGSYSNATVDHLFASAKADLDPAQRAGTLHQIDALLAKDLPSLPLTTWNAITLQDTSIATQLTDNDYSGGVLWDAFAWTVTG